jgi:hypothetical protein
MDGEGHGLWMVVVSEEEREREKRLVCVGFACVSHSPAMTLLKLQT